MLNKKTAKQETAMMLAVGRDHARCVRLLLESGADHAIANEDRETVLTKGTNTTVCAAVSHH